MISQLCSVTEMRTTSHFQGNVFIATGENDAIVCLGNCRSGPDNLVAQGLTFFPSAKETNYALVPHTGHDINLHYSATYSFLKVHEWLRKEVWES
jgi:hypothetical protein